MKPVIGITSHAIEGPALPATMGGIGRSSVSQQCVDALAAAGAAVVTIPIGLDHAGLLSAFGVLDGLLLPGGDDIAPSRYGAEVHPKLGTVDDRRDEMELFLARQALDVDLPILGICRGHQVLAVAGGGTLDQHLEPARDGVEHDMRRLERDYLAHPVELLADSGLSGILGRTSTMVNSLHHQAVRTVGRGFRVTGQAPDEVVEAIEVPDHRFAVGIQCHPECMWNSTAPTFALLFQALVEAAAGRRALRPSA